MRTREKVRLVTSLPQENAFPENRITMKSTIDRRKRRFTPAKGAIRMSRRYRICITGILWQESPLLKDRAALFIIGHLLFLLFVGSYIE
jgi:hypothetical protein